MKHQQQLEDFLDRRYGLPAGRATILGTFAHGGKPYAVAGEIVTVSYPITGSPVLPRKPVSGADKPDWKNGDKAYTPQLSVKGFTGSNTMTKQ